ncbi:antigen 34 kDa [Mycolicibacterium mageritense DSM 44476 = CIP 104973]|uniref:DUF5336 domain-containing protein n=1 Tax=Mycolicibacterium mageritense TaxID=53462 RepID=A0AAI8TQK9_MYCME|nr:DUF5336 domain-containing protein [Mycolicibacterium mageritense]MBN3457646.1 DUF5336 domain-containing protein [Mycobacterium sp. DSM 3803]OKH77688.1 hypothetical protein EB73_41600 [Mycobacterium sp. SWH-M3]MCC9183877.1 DUF5336 domain-containing protein [Mycolicibacterium mageritense]BBX31600.1 hypothetical protein MMAGJ_08820 [Mycolicibacterium mageritense]BDY26767.1 hypothetical protein hbim_00682 [Mycolicibacterium mageritense]
MTYPPNSPGYPPAPQYGQPQQTNKPAATAAGENKLPTYLLAGVAVLGVLAYLLSYAGLIKDTDGFAVVGSGAGTDVQAALLAGLLAGVGLLPKQKKFTAVVAAVATFALLLAISGVVGAFDLVSWAYWLVLVLILLQAGAAIAALLFDAGVLTPPAPKPVFEPQAPQYGQYGGPSQYYGQQSQPQHGGQPYQQAPSPQQRPGYPSQYGNYPGGSNTGGFPVSSQGGPQGGQHSGSQGGQQSGPPTPPTGFPAFGQPQQQSQQPSSSNANDQTTVVPTQQPSQQSSSQQSGPSQS